MTQYVVKIDERVTHSLVIEAETAGEALQLGYQLLTDGLTPEMEKEFDYELEADGYTGQDSVWEY
jgi:hypothetical protein